MKKQTLTKPMKKSRASFILGLVSAVFIGLTVLLIILFREYLSDPTLVREAIGEHYFLGALCMGLICAVQVIVALAPGELVEIAAGYAFGAWGGMFICLGGMIVGSVLVILFVRRFGRRFVYVFYPKEKMDTLPILNDPRKRNPLVFILFLIPGTPKDMLTYAIGLTDMSIPSYLALTTLARIPSLITSTLGGNAVGEKSYINAIIIFAVTAAISLTGLVVYNAIQKKHIAKNKTDATENISDENSEAHVTGEPADPHETNHSSENDLL